MVKATDLLSCHKEKLIYSQTNRKGLAAVNMETLAVVDQTSVLTAVLKVPRYVL